MSLFPQFVVETVGATVMRRDLFYTEGIHPTEFPSIQQLSEATPNAEASPVQIICIGSDGCSVPLPPRSVDFISLQCSFEHFEGEGDRLFVQEAFRLLKPNGKLLILPFYCGDRFQEIHKPEYATGCQFHRYYDPETFYNRVLQHLNDPFRVEIRYHTNHAIIDPSFYCAYSLCLVKKPTFAEKLRLKVKQKVGQTLGKQQDEWMDW